jgi:hypothetical protein
VRKIEPVQADRRGRDAPFAFLVSIGAAVMLLTVRGLDWWYLVFPLAGLIAGSLTRDRGAGLLGLLAGVLIGSLVWGAMTVTRQLLSCQPDCGGLSSPSITIVLVIVVGLAMEVGAAAGFIGGRLVRRGVGVGRSS